MPAHGLGDVDSHRHRHFSDNRLWVADVFSGIVRGVEKLGQNSIVGNITKGADVGNGAKDAVESMR